METRDLQVCEQQAFCPRWQLQIIGDGLLAGVLCRMAPLLDFEVSVHDPREEPSSSPDADTAVLALTHAPHWGDSLLMEALLSPAFYVGALGSTQTIAHRLKRLRGLDLPEQALDRLHGPMGFHVGSRRPAEIAVAVLAEIVAVRNGLSPRQGISRCTKACVHPSSHWELAS